MTIKVECSNPECGKSLTLDDSLAGKRIRCNACKQVVLVPGKETAPARSAGRKSGTARSQPGQAERSQRRPERRQQSRRPAPQKRTPPPRGRRGPARPARPRDEAYEDYEDYEGYDEDVDVGLAGSADDFDEYEDDAHEDEFGVTLPRRGPSRSGGGSWSKVGVGLLIVAIGSCIFGGSLGLLALSQAGRELGVLMMVSVSRPPTFESVSPRNQEEWRAQMEERREEMQRRMDRAKSARSIVDFGTTVRKVSRIVGLIAGVVCLVGYVFLLFAPNRGGTLAFAITALVLGVINPVLQLIFQVIPEFKERSDPPCDLATMALTAGGPYDTAEKILGLVFDTTFYLEFLMVSLFLVAAAGIKKRGELRKRNLLTVYLWGGVLGAILFVYIFVFVDWEVSPTSRWPLYMMWLMYWLVLVFTGAVTFLYIRGLFQTRRSVS